MANFDYDVLIIGSGFGGSVAALRAAEKGYLRPDTRSVGPYRQATKPLGCLSGLNIGLRTPFERQEQV
jgi:succinate dehydrogenase/fumarate reductase flavoprotein subunit